MRYAPKENALKVHSKRRPAMKKDNTVSKSTGKKTGASGRLIIGLDLGDRSSRYCILDEQGEVFL